LRFGVIAECHIGGIGEIGNELPIFEEIMPKKNCELTAVKDSNIITAECEVNL
jgi:hypothetical protein